MLSSMMRRVLASLLGVFLLTGALTACGSNGYDDGGYDPQAVAYQPATWGPSGYCYYVSYPQECDNRYGPNHTLLTAMLMPLAWHAMYAGYYDSPAYVSTYVPVRYRTVYVTHVHTFESSNKTLISSSSSKATWLGSNGKTVSGSKLGSTPTFKAGNMRSSGFSGGSLRSKSFGSTGSYGSSGKSGGFSFGSSRRSSSSGGFGGFGSSRSSGSFGGFRSHR